MCIRDSNCLDKWMGTPQQNVAALRFEAEDGQVHVLTYGDLYREVNRVANGLRSLGLGKGDAIALFMPMTPEIAIAMLAIAKIGGIILPLFSGYGAGAVATRLVDADAAGFRELITELGEWLAAITGYDQVSVQPVPVRSSRCSSRCAAKRGRGKYPAI